MITFCLLIYLWFVVSFWWRENHENEAVQWSPVAWIMHNLWSLFLFGMGVGAIVSLYHIRLSFG